MSDRLLVPLDGSEPGEAALPWAVHLARDRDLTLVLARVVPWPTYLVTGMDGYVPPEVYDEVVAGQQAEAQTYIGKVRRSLEEQGLKVETAIREGGPAETLLDLADEVGAVAIAMSTHGRGGLARVVRGSVAERVLQQSTVPVLLVRAQAGREAPVPRLGRLLIPLDGSRFAEGALEAARQLAGPATTLILVNVVAPIERPLASAEGGAMVPDEAATEQAVAQAEQYMEGVRRSNEAAGYAVEAQVRTGAAAREILSAAAEHEVDLVVMSTHGRTGPARWWMGSVADEVLRRADRPVLLVSARSLATRVVGALTVQDVMTRDVAAVRDEEPLITALRKLLRRRVSGTPVLDAGGKVVGIISEYDLLRWQASLFEELAREPGIEASEYARRLETGAVKQLMTHPAVTIEEAAPLEAAVKLFLERRLRRLPVTREGRLAGVVARADVLKAMADRWASTAGQMVPA